MLWPRPQPTAQCTLRGTEPEVSFNRGRDRNRYLRVQRSRTDVRSRIFHTPFLTGAGAGRRTYWLPHGRSSFLRGYDPDGPVVMGPFQGSKLEDFPRQPEIERSCRALHAPEAVRSAGKGRGATTRVALMGAPRIPGAMRAHDGRDAGRNYIAVPLRRSNCLCARPFDVRTTLVVNPLVDTPNVKTVQMQRPTGLLSSNDDNDTLQIRLEVDQCGGPMSRTCIFAGVAGDPEELPVDTPSSSSTVMAGSGSYVEVVGRRSVWTGEPRRWRTSTSRKNYDEHSLHVNDYHYRSATPPS
ncbi:hypothetical protein EVAR_65805_1 [Eumeta japonica]|uniref:Uncharacterized protein n=1 Tax=Eumeta variegata TaxID=151549 RepID=A0A4C1ZPK0_EUMVA|nr:hypothetical protein EVAR_65805_1 [Eumeta japonica]